MTLTYERDYPLAMLPFRITPAARMLVALTWSLARSLLGLNGHHIVTALVKAFGNVHTHHEDGQQSYCRSQAVTVHV